MSTVVTKLSRTSNRPFATNDDMIHAGGQARYSHIGTLKQRPVKLDWLKYLCFIVTVPE